MTAKELLQTASEQFLGKTSQEVQLTILQTLEGHLRAILGTLSVEEVRLCFGAAAVNQRGAFHPAHLSSWNKAKWFEWILLPVRVCVCVGLREESKSVPSMRNLRMTLCNSSTLYDEVNGTYRRRPRPMMMMMMMKEPSFVFFILDRRLLGPFYVRPSRHVCLAVKENNVPVNEPGLPCHDFDDDDGADDA